VDCRTRNPSLDPCVVGLLFCQVVEILVAAGAEVNAQNTDGHTALMFAYNGKTQVRRRSHYDRCTNPTEIV
jgi:ankyrin repeat protein